MKPSLMLLAGLGLAALLRRQSAAVRHWVLALAVGCAATVPLVESMGPSWQLSGAVSGAIMRFGTSPPSGSVTTRTEPQPPAGGSTASARAPGMAAPADSSRTPTAREWLRMTWGAGAILGVLLLVSGLGRLAWLASRARRLSGGVWVDLAGELAREYRLGRPIQVLQSDHASLLATWGFFRPSIIVPAGADSWTPDRIRVVLSHELAHVRRGDWIVQLGAELLRSFYWFNPLTWIVCRQLRLDSEQGQFSATSPAFGVRLRDPNAPPICRRTHLIG